MNKVLVTGATGCVGINLIHALAEKEYHVTATGIGKLDASLAHYKNISFIEARLEDAAVIEQLCKNQDIVVHCGALSSPWGKYHDFYQANVIGTQNIINSCLKNAVNRVVYISTPSLYFNFSDRLAIKETDALAHNPVNAYAQTKLLAEQAIIRAYQEQQLPVITLRPRAIFGPYDTALVPRVLRAVQKGVLPLINRGNALVDVTYVDNVVHAIMCSITADDQLHGSIYNITNGQPMPLRILLKKILTTLGYANKYKVRNIPYWMAYTLATLMEYAAKRGLSSLEPALTRYGVGVFAYSQTLDISAAQQKLGYTPRVSIDEGISRYAQWLSKR